jgi:acyl carrier protein
VTETEVREQLRRYIVVDLLKKPAYPLRDDEPLVRGGLLDSLAIAKVAVFVEDDFEVYIPDTELADGRLDTISQLAERVVRSHRPRQ